MLRLAFLWHQHQPCYRDPVTGIARLPWVRLHATKDYYGMARLLSEFPRIKATINIVPSLADQLLRYTDHGGSDLWLELHQRPVDSLTPEERDRVVADGFHANAANMIGALPRYEELSRRRHAGERFSTQDLLDVEVLSNLAWMHRTLWDEDALLRQLLGKGRGFTESEKRALLDKQREVARRVIPLHRRLEDEGRIEVTSTPFYHPILPLLCDFRAAFEAMPWLADNLGFEPVSLRADAVKHVDRAVEQHERLFGRRPRGMWPAEGSVSNDVVPILAARGIRWIATDEEILAKSLGRSIRRDGDGNVLETDLLYRPWRVHVGGSEIAVVFRDHRLSDLFGFHYQRDPAAGVADFVRRLAWIRDHAPDGALVSVILDGENAWEHYPGCGVPFFRSLYGALSELPWLETVRIGDAIEATPPRDALPRLFPGSWIDHNFYIWIGHAQDRTAWAALLEARRTLEAAESEGKLTADALARAWEEVYIAEGSDWCWWYGDDRSSGMDDVFDAIFRGHLRNVYSLIGRPAPASLALPIKDTGKQPPYERPRGRLDVVVDGRRTSYFEWLGAGRFRQEQEAGSMERAHVGSIAGIEFGGDERSLFLSLEASGGHGKTRELLDRVRVHFVAPKACELELLAPGRMRLGATELTSLAAADVIELAVPWSDLGVGAGEEVRFFVEARAAGGALERSPRGFALAVTVPSEGDSARDWSA